MGNCNTSRPQRWVLSHGDTLAKQADCEEEAEALLSYLKDDDNTVRRRQDAQQESQAKRRAYKRRAYYKSRAQRFWFYRKQKRALRERKRVDAVGSFGVNMLTCKWKTWDDCRQNDNINSNVTSCTSSSDSTSSQESCFHPYGQHHVLGGRGGSEEDLFPIEEEERFEVSFEDSIRFF